MSESDNVSSNYSELSFYVKSTECNLIGDISMDVLLGDFQEAADKGALDIGFDRSIINSHNACWIILKMNVEMYRMPVWRETFTIRTWSAGCDKFYFDREYQVYDSNNNLIGIASSVWILADLNTHRPLIPNRVDGLPEVFVQNDFLVFGERSKRSLPISKDIFEDSESIISKYADFSELDHNHHVNNSRYMAWAFDALYKSGFDLKLVKNYSLSYVSEVLPGEKVEIYIRRYDEDKRIIVSAFKNNDINVFDAEIFISDTNI